LIVEILTDAGYVAYGAPDGAGALGVLACHSPALIVLDVGWPDTRSIELIEQVRAIGLTTLPIVAMITAPDAAAPLLVAGAVACLAKPFNLDDLLACVARYVQPPAVSLHARTA